MRVIKSASNASVWKGIGYYQAKKVYDIEKINEKEYKSKVKGSDTIYSIFLNLAQPKKLTCECPHAKDRKVICKHIVATYFTLFLKRNRFFMMK